jgi:hypothetical protein
MTLTFQRTPFYLPTKLVYVKGKGMIRASVHLQQEKERLERETRLKHCIFIDSLGYQAVFQKNNDCFAGKFPVGRGYKNLKEKPETSNVLKPSYFDFSQQELSNVNQAL